MANRIIIANLKNGVSYSETLNYLDDVSSLKNDVVFAPSNIYLPMFLDKGYKICAQDVSSTNIVTTGEVTGYQLKSLGADYVIVSHNERVVNLAESIMLSYKKLKNALESNLKVIFCVGEIDKIDFDSACKSVLKKLEDTIFKIDKSLISNVILAYEPFYAINNSNSFDFDFTQKIVKFIKNTVYDRFNYNISVLYGGGVNKSNIDLLNKLEVEGFLIGKSSLDSSELKKVVGSIR